jgi:phosphopantetheinyl transferase (holo-ACP synthase)
VYRKDSSIIRDLISYPIPAYLYTVPLLYTWNSDAYSRSGIWEIAEPESFFKAQTGLNSAAIKNEKRRIERLAGRFLLRLLEKDFPLSAIDADAQGKPRIPQNRFFFSISHSWPYVAAVVSPCAEAGMDIQVHHRRMEQLQHKFVSPQEQSFFQQDPALLTMAWCAKEAAYKWQGCRGIDFIKHLPICDFYPAVFPILFLENENVDNILIKHKLMNPEQLLTTQCFVNQSFACSWVANIFPKSRDNN